MQGIKQPLLEKSGVEVKGEDCQGEHDQLSSCWHIQRLMQL